MNAIRKVPRTARLIAVALVVALAGWLAYTVLSDIGKKHITVAFPSTVGLYAGDEVRVLGVKVGTIDSIEPGKNGVTVELTVDRGIDLPADAKAVIVSPSLVTARFIQLAPAYTTGPKMGDNATIPENRTAIPVEWDDIKAELTKLATALGPIGEDDKGSFGRAIDTAAANLGNGNAEAFRSTLRELSSTLQTLSDGRTDLFGTIKNLQKFVDVLSKSNEQIVQFGGRLASVSSVLANVSTDLGTGLDSLDSAIVDVKRFLDSRGDQLTESVERLSEVTQNLADHRPELERVLHSGPTALVNFYQLYKPAQGTLTGTLAAPNFANPIAFLCGAVEAVEINDAQKSADLCKQYLGPVLNSLAMNYPPLLLNPATQQNAFPDQLIYSTPDVAARAQPGAPATSITDLLIPGGGQ
ncbi:MCE family protein [Nocardia sp. 2]|uniref:MCE family protein n=1 Tax=Nocardia acididurans TaxID=2802282 RepID=A0ABS1MA68_9NOCA|nr:MCE family protein [Nocardia acididurans]MBL1077512.1 MCE family protein [Nocardia acididurans]